MTEATDLLDERDDVRKTEYSRYDADESCQVTIELWHDSDGLQRIAERAMTGVARSQRGMQNLAEQEALAVRETRVDTAMDLRTLYPETVEWLEG